MWTTTRLADKGEILAFLETDRGYAAYAIGDLEPALFADCTWAVAAQESRGELVRPEALVLHYRGLDPAALVLMGEPEGLRAIMAHTLAPERVYLTCRPETLDLARAFYAWDEITPMWRMVLNRARFRPVLDVPDQAILAPLRPAHIAQVNALFVLGGGLAFSPAQVELGVFYGLLEEGMLAAVAGTHLVSTTYGVAAIGNVFTHPDFRRRGYGTLTTSAVTAELLRRGIQDVVLNVAQENAPALRIYERLGFERYCPFLEGPATKRKRYTERHRRDTDGHREGKGGREDDGH
jgi:GNAT superfamily N-acetyltransferase